MATTSEIRAYALKHGCTDAEALKALSAAKRMAEHSPQSRNDELEKAINELCLAESVIGMTAGQIPERLINRRDAAIQRLRDLYVVSEKQPTIRERAIQAFIQTCAGPAFTREEIREEAKHIVNKTGFYSEEAK